MSSLFKNNYKVYLYKFNYSALQNDIKWLLTNSANQFLFESFVTDLYTVGVPSDLVSKSLPSGNTVSDKIKSKYEFYVNEYYNKKSNVNLDNTKTTKQTGDSKTIEYKSIGKEDTDVLLKYNRATISGNDDWLQRALAQNYALQMLQRDYENEMMTSDGNEIKINWLNTMEPKKQYDEYIKKALNLSTELLNRIFDPVIDDIKAIQEGTLKESKYVYAIDLTDLTDFKVIETVETERTKYSSNNFMDIDSARGDLSSDSQDNAIDSIGVITTTLEGLSNMTNFNLRQDILLRHHINIEANDIIEIVNINQNKLLSKTTVADETNQVVSDDVNRNTQFIGFVTKVSLSQRFGSVSLLNVTCEGISKVLSMNATISNNSVAPQFSSVTDFIAGEDSTQKTSSAAVVNAFSSFFDGLNAFDLFTKLLSDVLAVSPVEEDKTNYTLRLISDTEKLKALPYQYAKPLIVLYHLALSISTIREIGHQTHIVLAQLENNVNQEKLQAYLLMIRNHYDLFWSTMTTPISILQTLAANTFLEIYEDRNGILILRPPRYNAWIEGDVIEEDNFIEWNQSIDDSTLKSRSDYQWSIPAIGVQNEFCGGYYQDVPALLKYGFRIDSPKNSPSVQSEIDAAVYSALDVTKANSNTRTFELTVPLTQDYILGRMYYFPINKSLVGNIKSTGFVGYLSTIATTISPGNVDIHRLTFKYMRNAELMDNEQSSARRSGVHILNFRRLPELSLYQLGITPEMIKKQEEGKLKGGKKKKKKYKSEEGFPANYRYYWASFDATNKKQFDEYTESNKYLPDRDIETLYLTMAPTNIRVKSFKSYDGVKSSQYSPTQQLINEIWYTDLMMRTNSSVDTNHVYVRHESREIRTRNNEVNFIKYLNSDATSNLKNRYKSIDYIKNISTSALSAQYATVNNNFFVNDSLYPNILSEFSASDKQNLETAMNEFNQYYTKYFKDNGKKSEYEYWYKSWCTSNLAFGRFTSDNSKQIRFNEHAKRLENVFVKYKDFCNNSFNYYDFEISYNNAGEDIEVFLKYVDEKEGNVIVNFFKKYFPAVVFAWDNIRKLGTLIKKTSKNISKSSVGIPAYVLNDMMSNSDYSKYFPLMQSLYKSGAYVSGVSPIDYFSELRKFNEYQVAPNLGINNTVQLENMSLKTARGEVVGTFKKLILDTKIYKNGFGPLYYYPVIEFNNSKIKDLYGIDVTLLKNYYITTEEEIRSFIANGTHPKCLPCVIRVGCIKIPESKIPTIQQIYNKGGLYVGVDKYTDGSSPSTVNDNKAIFNPSVLYTWDNNDLQNLYNVSIYNLIESINGTQFGSYLYCKRRAGEDGLWLRTQKNLPWETIIQNSKLLNRFPCVYNTKLKFKLSNKITIDPITQNSIINRFKSCAIKDVFEIDDFFGGYLYLNDKTILTESGDINKAITGTIKNSKALICTLGYPSVSQGTSANASTVSNQSSSSYTSNVFYSSEKTQFIKSVEQREQAQVALYNSDNSYMQLSSKNLYPYAIYETLKEDVNNLFEQSNNSTSSSNPDLQEFVIKREIFYKDPNPRGTQGYTIGKLYVNNKYYCDTLELEYRSDDMKNDKVPGATAIPQGVYSVKIGYLSTISREAPLLENVPGFTGVFMHSGASTDNTTGCILVGDYKNNIWSGNSYYTGELTDMVKDTRTTIKVYNV